MGVKHAAMMTDVVLATREKIIAAPVRTLVSQVLVVPMFAAPICVAPIRVDRDLAAPVVEAVDRTVAPRRTAIGMTVADPMNSDTARVITGMARVISAMALANSPPVPEWADGRAIRGRHFTGARGRRRDSFEVPATTAPKKVRAGRGIRLFRLEVFQSTKWHV